MYSTYIHYMHVTYTYINPQKAFEENMIANVFRAGVGLLRPARDWSVFYKTFNGLRRRIWVRVWMITTRIIPIPNWTDKSQRHEGSLWDKWWRLERTRVRHDYTINRSRKQLLSAPSSLCTVQCASMMGRVYQYRQGWLLIKMLQPDKKKKVTPCQWSIMETTVGKN